MIIDLKTLLEGKATLIKNKSYGSTESLVEPFLDKMSKFTDDFIINVIPPNQVTTKDGNEDLTYNRVCIQAVLPDEHTIEEHDLTYGFVYGLDVKKPIVKFYKGYLSRKNNLFVNKKLLICEELEDVVNYSNIDKLIKIDIDFKEHLDIIKSSTFEKSDIFMQLGRWCHHSITDEYLNGFTKTKLNKSIAIDAYKEMFINEDSEYYVKEEFVSKYDTFNAFASIVQKEKDIVNKYEKLLIINNILKI